MKGSTINNFPWTAGINHHHPWQTRMDGHPLPCRWYSDEWTGSFMPRIELGLGLFSDLKCHVLSICKFYFLISRLLWSFMEKQIHFSSILKEIWAVTYLRCCLEVEDNVKMGWVAAQMVIFTPWANVLLIFIMRWEPWKSMVCLLFSGFI